MRKFLLIVFALLVLPTICFAGTVSNDITDRTRDFKKNVGNVPLEDDGKWKYPLIGASAGATFYLDTTSCTYWITESVATTACIVYIGGRGAAPDGDPAKVTSVNFQFDTYKSRDGRKILLKAIDDESDGERFNYWLEWDNGFLLSLFWKSARYSGLDKYLE